MVKKVGKYEIGKTLGEGTFGKVKYAINSETKKHVAIKVLDKEKIQKQNMGAQIKKEISIMKMVKHDHVVSLIEVLASRTKIFIVLELITGGELFDKIVAEGRFNEDTARFYTRQLMSGVKYCHEHKICHRDLKPENLLLDEQGDLKISDFGLSALYNGNGDDTGRGTLLHTTCGTPNYVAPEVLADKGYDGRAADVWSCGVILYVLLAGFLPFDEPTMSALFRKIQSAEYTYPSWFSEDVKDLLDHILVDDPKKRFTIAQICTHKWMKPDEWVQGDAAPAKTKKEEADDKGAFTDTTVEGGEAADDDEGPRKINAFDLINMLGGSALNRMFMSDEEKMDSYRIMHFTSDKKPEEICDLMEAKLRKLKKMEHQMNEWTVDKKSWKVTGKIATSGGLMCIQAQVLLLSKDLNLIEIKRARGDILQYKTLIEELVKDMGDVMGDGAKTEPGGDNKTEA